MNSVSSNNETIHEELANTVSNGGVAAIDENNATVYPAIPNFKSQCLISVLEDAVDQLAVLDDIVAENHQGGD